MSKRRSPTRDGNWACDRTRCSAPRFTMKRPAGRAPPRVFFRFSPGNRDLRWIHERASYCLNNSPL